MGHSCRICGRLRANEAFTGRGHRDHVCRECQRLPRESRDRAERREELLGFLHQSQISLKNLARLTALSRHADPEIATLATLIFDIARAHPAGRNRWIHLAQRHRPLFDRALAVLGIEFFEDWLAGFGDFENPLWEILDGQHGR